MRVRATLRPGNAGAPSSGPFRGTRLASRASVGRLASVLMLALAALGFAPAPANAWLHRAAGSRFAVDDAAVATAVDSHGDVLAVTVSEPDPGVCQLTASKRDGTSGATLWTRPLGRCLYHTEAKVAVTTDDDAVVAL